MAKRLLTIVLTTFALFVGQQIFSGCETASADDPEYSGTVNNTGEDSSGNNSSGNQNNAGSNGNSSLNKALAWKDPPPSNLNKGEIATFTVINNTGSLAWSVTPSGAATVSSIDGASAIVRVANPTDATSIKVTATDQTTKKSISAEITLANPL